MSGDAFNGAQPQPVNRSSPKEGTDDSGSSGLPLKPAILRLMKNSDNDAFEKQGSSKNDSYCWVCHDGGDVLCCDKCPRVFHLTCCNLEKPPEDEDKEWVCSVCQNIARKTKRSRPTRLKELLMLAIERMSFPGTELFRTPVPDDIRSHYKEFVFHPMDLGTIKEKIRNEKYQSTREFLHDTEWILHNCTIYNGAKHALTKIAKNIVKVCMEDMREIELCPGCYSLTVEQPPNWFCIPCTPPHPVVLAKVRGYPLWPAKLISETKDKCDVRFFGQHDRSLVPKSEIQVLKSLPPKPSSKTKHWNLAMHELKMYGANVSSQRNGDEGGEDGKEKKKKDKLLLSAPNAMRTSPSKGTQPQQPAQEAAATSVAMAPPPVVQVTGSSGAKGDFSMNSTSDAEASSPGTPPSLQIDLDNAGGRNRLEKSPNRGRPNPSGGMSLFDGIRSSQVTGTLDFPNGGGNSMQAVLMNPPGTQPGSAQQKKKPGKAGASLSDLITTLTKRRMGHVGGETGTSATTPGAPGVPQVTDGTAEGGKKQKSGSGEESQDMTSSPFSSQYESSKKTAIAVVDPNQKRLKRKTPKGTAGDSPAPKKPRIANPTPDINLSDPAAYVAKIQEYGSAVIGAINETTSPTPSQPVTAASAPAQVLPPMANVPGENLDVRANKPAAPLPPRTVGVNAKRKKRLDKNRSKVVMKTQGVALGKTALTPAQKTVTSAIISAISTALVTSVASSSAQSTAFSSAATSTVASTTALASPVSSLSVAPALVPGLSQQAPVGLTRHVSPASSVGASSSAAERQPDVAGEDSGTVGLGGGNSTGLMADTIRKVNASFLTRVNQMTNVTGDMGYKYFMEKLMSSVKNIVVEMLSTFESKSRLSAKQLREQLHQCWPVPNSASYVEQLGKELREEMKQALEVVRASAALELEQVVNEVRRQVEKEKEIAIAETKRKRWCTACYKEAIYHCCYLANYCSEECQKAHWEKHSSECEAGESQLQPPSLPGPSKPAPAGVPGGPVDTTETHVRVSGGATEPHGPGPVSSGPSSAESFLQAMQVQGQPRMQQHQAVTGGDQALGTGRMSPANIGLMSGASVSSQMLSNGGMSHHLLQSHQMDTGPSPQLPTSQGLVDPVAIGGGGVEQQITAEGMTTANTASPPNHIRNILLNQHHQQSTGSSSKGGPPGVITGASPMMMTHQSPAPSHHPALHSSSMGPGLLGGLEMHGSGGGGGGPPNALPPSRGINSSDQSSIHNTSQTNSTGGLLHSSSQQPLSPASSSENTSTVHNYGNWTYQSSQPHLIIGHNDSFNMPILPPMQATTPTTQNHTFFKAAY